MPDPSTGVASLLDRRLILHLRRLGWATQQIAALLECDENTVLQEAREVGPPESQASSPSAVRSGMGTGIYIRLTDDAQKLQLWLPAGALQFPTEVLLVLIHEECARRGIEAAVSAGELECRMRIWVYGTWLTVLEATPATPGSPSRVRLLVPVKPVSRRTHSAACVVQAGTVLARLEPGHPGKSGSDLLGRVVEPRRLPPVRLPCGEHTHLSADGMELLASTAGRAVLRKLRIDVIPQVVHRGDVTAASGVLTVESGLIVTGAVGEHAVIEASSDVHIQQGVQSAQIAAAQGSIVVSGTVVGARKEPCVLRAGHDVVCGRVAHALLEARGDIVIHGEVHYSRLIAGGNIYLPHTLDRCLYDVELTVGGGVFTPTMPYLPSEAAPTERQHTRVPVSLEAQVALHGKLPLRFLPVTLVDVSPSGVRCHLPQEMALAFAVDSIVQVKCALPEGTGDLVAIARVVRLIPPADLGLAFMQITERDANRLSRYYLAILRDMKDLQSGSRADRRARR